MSKFIKEIKLIEQSGLFDLDWYREQYPDLKILGMGPIEHYLQIGAFLGRDPAPSFSTSQYLRHYGDVAQAGINPLLHYILNGRCEGRSSKASVALNEKHGTQANLSNFSANLSEHLKVTKSYMKRKSRNNKIVVYTALISDYDSLKAPLRLDPEIDYVCFTDNFFPGLHGWEFRAPAFFHDDPTRIARYHKTHPYLLFPDHEVAVWIDATLLIRETCDIQSLVRQHQVSGAVVSTCAHPYRSDVFDEYEACSRQGKDDNVKMRAQVERYQKAGLQRDSGLAETMVVISCPRERTVRKLFKTWWREIEIGSRRDQISLPYACYEIGSDFNHLFPIGYDFRYDVMYFKYFEHKAAGKESKFGTYTPPTMPMEPQECYPARLANRGSKRNYRVALVLGSLAEKTDFTGTSYIRLLLPFYEASRLYANVSYTIVTEDVLKFGCSSWEDNVDAIYCLRNTLSGAATANLIRTAREKGLRLAYDIDDNLLIKAPNFDVSRADVQNVKALLSAASVVSVSTEPLAKLCKPMTSGRVILRRNVLAPKIWPTVRPLRQKADGDKKIRVLYMGTRSHDGDLSLVAEAAQVVSQRYRDLEFHVIGGLQAPVPWLKPVDCGGKNYCEFVKRFRDLANSYDFAISPLADTEFNKYKSFIKYLDYSAAGLPAIFSDHPIYRHVIRNGDNGILSQNTTASWVENLTFMIEKADEREKIARNAFSDVTKHRMASEQFCDTLIRGVFPSIELPSSLPASIAIESAKVVATPAYRSYADLVTDIRNNIGRFPRDVDLVVGIPRSGMIPAYVIGSIMNRSVISLDEFTHGVTPSNGDRKLGGGSRGVERILIVDDSVNLGNAYARLKAALPASYRGKPFNWDYFAIYASESGAALGVNYIEVLPTPRIFQWNYRNHGIAKQSCYDIDGVLCIDPTDEENDDGPCYRKFLLNAVPLFIPTHRIRALVTSRLEKYRPETEEWLAKHGVVYDRLFMLDLPSKEERLRRKAHGSFKADVYKDLSDCVLFVESNAKQAREISRLSRKAVICTDTDEFFLDRE